MQMLLVTVVGGVLALGTGSVGVWKLRKKGAAGAWLLAAAILLSPWAYFALWNAFFRADPPG
jgi:hypothetical protein